MADRQRQRKWANIAVLIVGVYQFGLAFWGIGLAQPAGIVEGVRWLGWYWFTSGFGGLLAIASVIVAVRSATAGRVLLGLAAALVLSGGFAFSRLEGRLFLDVILPGLILLAALPFFGTMPTPEQQGENR